MNDQGEMPAYPFYRNLSDAEKERGMTAHDGLATFAIEAADALLAALSDQPTRQEE